MGRRCSGGGSGGPRGFTACARGGRGFGPGTGEGGPGGSPASGEGADHGGSNLPGMVLGREERAEPADEVESLLDDFPLREVLISMPGVGAMTAPTTLPAIGAGSACTEGKEHHAAVICLARRRCDVIHAMLRNGSLYPPCTPPQRAAAA